jgi:hypothetical protein
MNHDQDLNNQHTNIDLFIIINSNDRKPEAMKENGITTRDSSSTIR